MRNIVKALRVEHWIKNSLVLAAFLFALGDPLQAAKLQPLMLSGLKALGAAALFCLISSAVYVMNDIRDVALDRLHPVKQKRPIASGALSIPGAMVLGVLLLICGLAGSYVLAPRFAMVAVAYVLLQIAYSVRLKRVALLDVMIIAAGFVLRALAGAVALDLTISAWLILCTLMLALFLGFCKRRQEKIALDDAGVDTRPSLEHYDEKVLDQLIAISASSTIVSYALYTLSSETVAKFGSHALGFTIPFVVFGIFRYLHLAYRHEKGERPERVLLTDLPILLNVFLFAVTVVAIFWLR